jgi:hypothetical protein
MARVKRAGLTLPRVAALRLPSLDRGLTLLARVQALTRWQPTTAIPGWSRFIPWAAFALVVVIALAHP